ncbi:MAG: pyridoxamine 5'-phosphate oxidase family protein, partial [Pseudolabrys sp.]
MKPDNAFDARLAAKKLLREGRSGALATLRPRSGDPYCSLVNVATAIDGAPLFLLSNLALHTKNILADARVSLMLDERKDGDPLEGARVMLMGSCAKTDPAVAGAYLRRHLEAEMFANFGDFAFYRMEIGRAHLVAGFGRIVDVGPKDLLAGMSDAQALVESETGAIAHMNEDHADACRLFATKLLGGPDGDWRCVGIDPEGLELQQGRTALR